MEDFKLEFLEKQNIGKTEKGQIKSRERVVEHGEVYTNQREVKAMLRMIYNDIKYDSEKLLNYTFLDPAVGDGNFLVEILKNKLSVVEGKHSFGIDFKVYSLLGLSNLYGIDILRDNVKECRKNLFNVWNNFLKKKFKKEKGQRIDNTLFDFAKYILSKNIILGNGISMKKVDNNQKDLSDEIVFYEWKLEKENTKFKDFDQFIVNVSPAEMGDSNTLFDNDLEYNLSSEDIKIIERINNYIKENTNANYYKLSGLFK